MTRGPQPLKAIACAKEIAGRQGQIMSDRTLLQSRYSFILFRKDRTVFVRVKRIRTHVSEPREINLLFHMDVLQLRMLPETPVTSREIWTLSPWNVWQFFVVKDDRLMEIRHQEPPEVPHAEKDGTVPAVPVPAPGIPPTTGKASANLGAAPEVPRTGSPDGGVEGGAGPSVGGDGPGRGVQV